MLFIVEVDGGQIKVQDKDGNLIDSEVEGALRRLLVGSRAHLVDGVNKVELAVVHDTAVPANTRGLLVMGADSQDVARRLLTDGEGKLKVAAQPPSPPPGTTPFVLAGDTPLSVGPVPNYQEAVSAVISNGTKLYLQTVAAGAAGDPSENGSKVEVYWREGSPAVNHLITRMYLTGQTVNLVLPDAHTARDGTEMTGNGSNTYLVIRRERLSTAAQEIDAEVRGYTET